MINRCDDSVKRKLIESLSVRYVKFFLGFTCRCNFLELRIFLKKYYLVESLLLHSGRHIYSSKLFSLLLLVKKHVNLALGRLCTSPSDLIKHREVRLNLLSITNANILQLSIVDLLFFSPEVILHCRFL